MMGKLIIIFSALAFSLSAQAKESFNSLVKSAAKAQCAQMIIEAHDKQILSQQRQKPLFNSKKAHKEISKEMDKLAIEIMSNPKVNEESEEGDKRYDLLVDNILNAAKKADPYFHNKCLKQYAVIYKSCSNAGSKAALCVARQKVRRKGAMKTLWAHINGSQRANIALRD